MTEKEMNMYDNFIITIGKFLSHYYYINLSNASKLSHEAFMEIFGLKSISTSNINLEKVLSGDVLLVSDAYERVYGYKNPLIINHNEENEEFFIRDANIEFEESKETDFSSLNLEKLSDYELDQLLSESKKLKDERIKNKIIKELRFRPDSKPGRKSNLIEKVRKREFKKIKGVIEND